MRALRSTSFFSRLPSSAAPWILIRSTETGFVTLLNSGGATLPQVATVFVQSQEYFQHLVNQIYGTILGRQGSAAETSGWVQLLQQGKRDEVVLGLILASIILVLFLRVVGRGILAEHLHRAAHLVVLAARGRQRVDARGGAAGRPRPLGGEPGRTQPRR